MLIISFFLFKATPESYGNSKARGWIRAIAEVCAIAKAMLDLSHICNLCCSLWQRWILNPMSEAKDQTCILTETAVGTSQVLNPLSHNGNAAYMLLKTILLQNYHSFIFFFNLKIANFKDYQIASLFFF